MKSSDNSTKPPVVLTFAATDPTGGAGIQADLMTICSLGGYPLSVVTAITVQNSSGVEALLPIDSSWVTDQAYCLLEDIQIDAFKVGLPGSTENITALAKIIARYPEIPLILDPILTSGRGDPLTNAEMIEALKEHLLPKTTVLTPNSIEARRLALENGNTEEAEETASFPDYCAQKLVSGGPQYVLLTGTHIDSPDVVNTLYGRNGLIRRDTWPRLPGSYHGSGCTLASALAVNMARGLPVEEATHRAQKYTWQTLAKAFRLGKGQSIPNRFSRNA